MFCSEFSIRGVALRCVYFLAAINGAETPPSPPPVSGSLPPSVSEAQLWTGGSSGPGISVSCTLRPVGFGSPPLWHALGRVLALADFATVSTPRLCVWAQKRRRCLSGDSRGCAPPRGCPRPSPLCLTLCSPFPSLREPSRCLCSGTPRAPSVGYGVHSPRRPLVLQAWPGSIPGKLLEMQISRPHPRPPESQTLLILMQAHA